MLIYVYIYVAISTKLLPTVTNFKNVDIHHKFLLTKHVQSSQPILLSGISQLNNQHAFACIVMDIIL